MNPIIEKHLIGGCKSEKLARCATAADAHSLITGVIMTPAKWSDSEDREYLMLGKLNIAEDIPEQEVLVLTYHIQDDASCAAREALIFENYDAVLICDYDPEEKLRVEHTLPDVHEFFRYLNKFPNIHLHTNDNSDELLMGLELLASIAEPHSYGGDNRIDDSLLVTITKDRRPVAMFNKLDPDDWTHELQVFMKEMLEMPHPCPGCVVKYFGNMILNGEAEGDLCANVMMGAYFIIFNNEYMEYSRSRAGESRIIEIDMDELLAHFADGDEYDY